MLKRILTVGVAAVALALVAPVIGAGVNVAHAGEDCADGASAHASGEDCPPAPQAPAQPAPQPQPAPEAPKEETGGGSESGGGSQNTPSAPQVVQTETSASAGVDTGTIPQGGIQAGAGGTAGEGSTAGLLWGGALILLVAAGGLALRRGDGLTS